MTDRHNTTNRTRREIIKAAGAGAAALGAGRSALGAAAGEPAGGGAGDGESFFFLVMADPQLFGWPKNDPAGKWALAIRHANRLKPDFVIVCGDMINRDGNAAKVDLARDTERYEAYRKIARALDKSIPLYEVAGNHDVCNAPTAETLGWYEARFARPWYSFSHKGCLFIILESDVIKDPRHVPETLKWQMHWLRQTLALAAKRTYRHKMVFLHHPIALKAVDEKDQYFNLPSARRAELLALFEKHRIEATFSGHYHRNAYVRHKGIELITTSGISQSSGVPAGFRIVKVTPGRIAQKYYGYADLPRTLE